jgi:AraC family transcriptional activator of pobA
MYNEYALTDFFTKEIPYKDFQVNRLEEMPALPSHIKSPHKHLFYELFLVSSGAMIHNADFKEFQLSANTLFFISQGQLHIWAKNIIKPLVGFRLMFTESFMTQNFIKPNFLFELVYLNNIYFNPLLTVEPNAKIYTYFELLQQEYEDQNRNTHNLQAMVFLILNEIQKIAIKQIDNQAQSTNDLSLYKQFLYAVENSFHQNISIDQYAESLCISTRQLSRIVKNITNLTLNQVIQNRRILEAKRLLKYSTYSIGEISFCCGFEDTSYFIRLFKKMENCTPTEFKKVL